MTPEELQFKIENATEEDIARFKRHVAIVEALKEELETTDQLLIFLAFAINGLHYEFDLDIETFIDCLRRGDAVTKQACNQQH